MVLGQRSDEPTCVSEVALTLLAVVRNVSSPLRVRSGVLLALSALI